jgi:hypothetical protein
MPNFSNTLVETDCGDNAFETEPSRRFEITLGDDARTHAATANRSFIDSGASHQRRNRINTSKYPVVSWAFLISLSPEPQHKIDEIRREDADRTRVVHAHIGRHASHAVFIVMNY